MPGFNKQLRKTREENARKSQALWQSGVGREIKRWTWKEGALQSKAAEVTAHKQPLLLSNSSEMPHTWELISVYYGNCTNKQAVIHSVQQSTRLH